MQLGPWLVIRGSILGIVFFIFGASALSTDYTLTTFPSPASSSLVKSNGCPISSIFPDNIRQWCDTITEQANSHQLSPDLVAAVIWQESGGDARAYSKSGAVGLMQVMPRDGTAASFNCINGPCFKDRPSIQELLDPSFNIQYGTNILARLFSRHGNVRDALKSYGPMDIGYSYSDRVLSIYQKALANPTQ